MPVIFSLLLISISSVTQARCDTHTWHEQSKVRTVIDGDTLILSDGRHIRVIGINTPEVAYKDKPGQKGGIAATHALSRLIQSSGDRVGLIYDVQRFDKYKRTLAHIFSRDGHNLTASMLNAGHGARVTVSPNTRYLDCYSRAEQNARKAKRGIWQSGIFSATPTSLNSGYHILRASIRHIGASKRHLYFDFDRGLSAKIPKALAGDFAQYKVGDAVLLRGWFYQLKSKGHRGEKQIFLNHPANISKQ